MEDGVGDQGVVIFHGRRTTLDEGAILVGLRARMTRSLVL